MPSGIYIRSEEAKRKISDAHKCLTKEQKKYHKERMNSSEVREKMSIAHIGKKQSKETIEKRVKSRQGYKHSNEIKEKIRISNIGKHAGYFSEEHKRKISIANKGRKLSEITKRKISLSHMGIRPTEETRRKLRISHKGPRPWRQGKEIFGLRGKNHPNWKGGVTPESEKRIHTIEWKRLRKQVYAQDNWTCQICGKHCRGDIQCHHIIPYRIIQNNDIGNLITLCRSCHIKEEHKYYNNFKGQLELKFN